MMVIENNFYINILNKIANNEKRYFLNFVFLLRYFAHDCSRHTHRHTHTHIHTHTYTHTYTEHKLYVLVSGIWSEGVLELRL